VPVLVLTAHGAVRRACLAAGSVLLAAGVAGLTGAAAPFTGGSLPEGLDLGSTSHPGEALGALVNVLGTHPVLWIEALVAAAAAAAVALARARGPWGVAAWASAFLAAALLAPWGEVSAFPTAVWIWAGAALVAVPVLRTPR
jgi:hypothetical protein